MTHAQDLWLRLANAFAAKPHPKTPDATDLSYSAAQREGWARVAGYVEENYAKIMPEMIDATCGEAGPRYLVNMSAVVDDSLLLVGGHDRIYLYRGSNPEPEIVSMATDPDRDTTPLSPSGTAEMRPAASDNDGQPCVAPDGNNRRMEEMSAEHFKCVDGWIAHSKKQREEIESLKGDLADMTKSNETREEEIIRLRTAFSPRVRAAVKRWSEWINDHAAEMDCTVQAHLTRDLERDIEEEDGRCVGGECSHSFDAGGGEHLHECEKHGAPGGAVGVMTVAPKLSEIAARIRAHLVRFELDPKINAPDVVYKTRPYYNANSWVGGSRVGVRYISYHGESFINKADAMKYLAWLDAGNVGRHYEALKDQR